LTHHAPSKTSFSIKKLINVKDIAQLFVTCDCRYISFSNNYVVGKVKYPQSFLKKISSITKKLNDIREVGFFG